MQTKFISDLGASECAWQVLLVGKDEQDGILEFFLGEHLVELFTVLINSFAIVGVHDVDEALCVGVVVPPQESNLILTTDVPHVETNVLVLYGLNIEANCWNDLDRAGTPSVPLPALRCGGPHRPDVHVDGLKEVDHLWKIEASLEPVPLDHTSILRVGLLEQLPHAKDHVSVVVLPCALASGLHEDTCDDVQQRDGRQGHVGAEHETQDNGEVLHERQRQD